MDDGGEWRAVAAGAVCAVTVALGPLLLVSESPTRWNELAFWALLGTWAVMGYVGRSGGVVAVPVIVNVLLYPLYAPKFSAANGAYAHDPFPPWVGVGVTAAMEALVIGVGFIVWQVVRYRRSQGRSGDDAG